MATQQHHGNVPVFQKPPRPSSGDYHRALPPSARQGRSWHIPVPHPRLCSAPATVVCIGGGQSRTLCLKGASMPMEVLPILWAGMGTATSLLKTPTKMRFAFHSCMPPAAPKHPPFPQPVKPNPSLPGLLSPCSQLWQKHPLGRPHTSESQSLSVTLLPAHQEGHPSTSAKNAFQGYTIIKFHNQMPVFLATQLTKYYPDPRLILENLTNTLPSSSL